MSTTGLAWHGPWTTPSCISTPRSPRAGVIQAPAACSGSWVRGCGSATATRTSGNLVWKMETRNPIFGNPTPRDMGFDTGSALSTANYKVLDYWGITDLYWKQRFKGGKYAFVAGHMDPGDWADQYPMLNAWTSFTNDAFYNNPTEAIPKSGDSAWSGKYFLKKTCTSWAACMTPTARMASWICPVSGLPANFSAGWNSDFVAAGRNVQRPPQCTHSLLAPGPPGRSGRGSQ